jgi:meso-butanediol dehydrogenase / (S,S)-butanediol dehydrogenase / diacetyl reductase
MVVGRVTAPSGPTASGDAAVAVVTGGGRGLGRAIVSHLGRAGFDVVVNHRASRDAAVEAVAELEGLGRRAVAMGGDVVEPSTHDALVEAAADLGELQVWVNNAGVSSLAPVVETKADEFDRMYEINVRGTFLGLQAAARHMIVVGTAGRIINISSECGLQAFPRLGAYSATKFAVVGLTQAAALELAPNGITVNAVCPGTAETDMVDAERASEADQTGLTLDQVRTGYLDAIPMGRFCAPDDVAALVAFVAGPGASYVTGQSLCTNGGSVLR